MAKKPVRKKRWHLGVLGVNMVDFPVSGAQNCFPATEGYPFVVHGPKPASGTVIAFVKIIVVNTGEQFAGTMFQDADFTPDDDDPTVLEKDEFKNHKVIPGGKDSNWAAAFPWNSTNFPEGQMVLIVTAMNTTTTTEQIVQFSHLP